MIEKIFKQVAAALAVYFVLTSGAALAAAKVCYHIADENGVVVYVTGWKIRVGDEFLTADNKRYEIMTVQGDRATARLLGVEGGQRPLSYGGTPGNIIGLRRALASDVKKVAIYHTHNDEAYEPSDGQDSADDGRGGILKVGAVFGNALKEQGIEPLLSDTNHSPHDDMAYERSRRTVVNLLKQQPDAIFDIHRDATPPEVYRGEAGGEEFSKIQFVVGKYGPTAKQIEEYALQMKAVTDEKHPGLIKGIFFAKGGDYNQDLHPKSMLLEVGANTNSRESAERGIAMFADTVPAVLGVTSANRSNINGAMGLGTKESGLSGSMKSIGWIMAVVIGGTLLYMYLSTGSLQEATAKMKDFTSREFGDITGRSHDKNKNDNSDDTGA